MPIDPEVYDELVRIERESQVQQKEVSPRFAFWTIFIIVSYLVVGLIMRWNGW